MTLHYFEKNYPGHVAIRNMIAEIAPNVTAPVTVTDSGHLICWWRDNCDNKKVIDISWELFDHIIKEKPKVIVFYKK